MISQKQNNPVCSIILQPLLVFVLCTEFNTIVRINQILLFINCKSFLELGMFPNFMSVENVSSNMDFSSTHIGQWYPIHFYFIFYNIFYVYVTHIFVSVSRTYSSCGSLQVSRHVVLLYLTRHLWHLTHASIRMCVWACFINQIFMLNYLKVIY